MTFSQSVKNEIMKSCKGLKGCCATSFLTAAIKGAGSLTLGFRGYAFSIESDNTDFLALCKNLAARLGVSAEVETYNVNAKGVPIYSCKFDGQLGEKLGFTYRDSDGTLALAEQVQLPTSQCCQRAFLQGLFVACGSVVIPQPDDGQQWENVLNTKYHLELRFTDVAFAEIVKEGYPELQFNLTPRKNHVILYLKNSERIADCFVYLNAMKAKLQLENVIIGRSLRNIANRQSNCIAANIEKSVAAASKQMDAITLLKQKGLFDGLSDSLKQIADMREKYPEATLEEIADMLKISKSGANHRFAKLIELSKK